MKTFLCFAAVFVLAAGEAKSQSVGDYTGPPTVTGFWQGTLDGDTLVFFLLERDDGRIFGTAVSFGKKPRTWWAVDGVHSSPDVTLWLVLPGEEDKIHQEKRVFRGKLSEFSSFTGGLSMTGNWSEGDYALSATQVSLRQIKQ